MDDSAPPTLPVLLAEEHARLAAVDERGLFVPLPAGLAALLAAAEHPPALLTGTTALDVVAPADRVAVIDAWDECRRSGTSSLVIHLAAAPDQGAWVLHFLDVRELCGCYVALCLPTDEVPRTQAADPFATERPPPRLVRVRKDQTAVLVEVDEAITELLGWRVDELVGHRSSDFIHPDDQELAIASWIELLAAPGLGRRVRLRHARRDGGWAWFELTNHNLLAEQGHVLCEMVDISEEMAAHEALRAREQLLHRLAEALPAGVVQVDAVGTVVYANSQATELFGADCTVLSDLTAAVSAADRDRLTDCFRSVLDGASGGALEVTLPGEQAVTYASVVVRRLDDSGATTGAIACFNDVTESTKLRHELQQQARLDPLTQVLNHSMLLDTLEQALREPGGGVAAIFIDLDEFKAVNDRNGHQTGDALLCRVAEVLRGSCREHDVVGRLGGDEFLVACTDVASPRHAERLGQRFSAALRAAASEGGPGVPAASLGVAWTRAGVLTARELVAAADEAMYAAKAYTGNRVVLASTPTD